MTDVFPDAALSDGSITLRPFAEADLPGVLEAANDPLTRTWLPLPSPYTLETARTWSLTVAPEHRTSGRGLVRAVDVGGRLVGAIDLKRTDWVGRTTEIGYWTHPAARGQGVMTVATTLLARWVLQEMGFERVELRIAPGNAASVRVAEKAGFTREGVARNAGYVDAGRVDLVIFSLVPGDLGATTGAGSGS